ncbi:SGNH/GDSL hydrolase family protein [Pelagibacterium xiamenense]|uniref:SGNH/GDSL hydrolase family protein n=1 Tax=Pelagibacterium xiamenense TaxID=2901140 RepID=UPI001E40AD18|nr:SGNH/GDSL hydrolase family protein [Pelagibacterium xiamenense]MCD7060982.1 SGNH/GDSL hydrolase family protein [Pelagibacterium xiamenense]
MKTILAYGDSLTFGADPAGGPRHAYEDRWPTRLEAGLAGKARVIAEGLGGRTTVFDDFSSPADRNGARTLPTLLSSHQPIDCVVIMLGTNDMKSYICGSALGAAMGMKRLAEIVRTHPYDATAPVPEVVLVAPPHCIATEHADLSTMFRHGMTESPDLAGHYERVARDTGCTFFDAASVAKASPLDGVHLDAANTRAIGDALAPVVSKLLGL